MKDIISNIPWIFVYVIPGFLTISLFNTIKTSNVAHDNKLATSCVLSFVFVTVLRLVYKTENIYIESSILIIAALVVATIAAKLTQWKPFRSLLRNTLGYSPSKDALDEVFDYTHGSCIKVVLKSTKETIIGDLLLFNNIAESPWIAISYFFVFKDGNYDEPCRQWTQDNHCIMVNLNDVEYAEVWTNHGDPKPEKK